MILVLRLSPGDDSDGAKKGSKGKKGASDGITPAEFYKIDLGMSKEAVWGVVGGPCQQVDEDAANDVQRYECYAPSGHGHATLEFAQGRLTSKSQTDLEKD